MTTTKEFFQTIFEGGEGYWPIQVWLDDMNTMTTPRWFEEPFNPYNSTEPETYVSLQSDSDIYFTPYLFSEELRRKGDPLARGRVVWAEADTARPELFRVKPSIIVETSPEHYHLYWLLDEWTPVTDIVTVNQLFYEAHKEQGCDAGWAEAKLLRVPGSTNNKERLDEPFHVTILENNGLVYSLGELRDAYSDITPPPIHTGDVGETPAGNLSDTELIALEQRLRDNNLIEVFLTPPAEGVSWFKVLYRFLRDLKRIGFTQEEAFYIANDAACNKYKRDKRSPSELWRDVVRAYESVEDVPDVSFAQYAPPVRSRAVFLSKEERESKLPTFIDTYQEWVAKRTDSLPEYQRSLAVMLLSCTFGDKGSILTRHGDENLAFWLMLLGPTTRGRKTTAQKLFSRNLDVVEAITGRTVDIGNDVTSEGLTKVLGTRDGETSLVWTDEVQAFLKAMLVKDYMGGLRGFFAELYSGTVRVSLRASKDRGNEQKAKTTFNFLGIGIDDQVPTVLTKEDFRSGFLPRFVWSIGSPPPATEDDWAYNVEAYDENKEFEERQNDPDIDHISRDLVERYLAIASKRSLQPSAEALERLNEFGAQLYRTVREDSDTESLEAIANRLQTTVLKTAALLALYDNAMYIGLREHVLPAIEMAEEWFANAVFMSRQVSASSFERVCEDIHAFIQAGTNGERTPHQVFRKFSNYRPAEVKEFVDSLRYQGRIIDRGNWKAVS